MSPPGVGSTDNAEKEVGSNGGEVDNDGEDESPITAAPASVEISDVHFSYSTRPDEKVLNGLSLSVPGGHTVAIVGQSGCGKSTVVSLLARFYDVERGKVEVGGRDVRELGVKDLRGRIGVISQEVRA